MRLAAILPGLLAAALAAGCGQPPADRIQAARERLEGLADEAEIYAPGAWSKAEQAVKQLDAELEAQEGRFFRSYRRTEELIPSVETAADDVRKAIDAEKKRLQDETSRLVSDARRSAAEARTLVDALPPREVPADRISGWRAELEKVEGSLEQVDKLLAAGRLLEAHREAEATLKAASGVNTAASEVQADLQQSREEAAARAARGDVSIPRTVLADGKPLGASTYRLRLGDETAAGRWVEFLRNGTVAGRALAVVIPDAEIREVAKTPSPRNEARVDQLRGGEYVRVWLNRDRTNYLLHLPIESR